MKPCRRTVRYAKCVPLAVLVLGTLIAWLTPLDMAVETHFFDAQSGGWPTGKLLPFALAYKYGQLIGWIPALFAVAILVAGIWKRSLWRLRRVCVFLIALLAVGPGLLVNVVMKEYWGRPRPRQIEQFDGKYEFQHAWVIGHRGDGKKSFPSGHAAMGFYFTAPYFILLATRRKAALAWLWGGVAFGLFIGIARMAQGAHWPSDVLWSFGIVYLSAYALARLLRLDSIEREFTQASSEI